MKQALKILYLKKKAIVTNNIFMKKSFYLVLFFIITCIKYTKMFKYFKILKFKHMFNVTT